MDARSVRLQTSDTETGTSRQGEFRKFAREEIAPRSFSADSQGVFPADLITRMAQAGYLGATIPAEFGGGGMSQVEFGLLCEEIARACSAARSLVTVQNMVGHAIERWGTADQKKTWLPRLASGDVVAGFCLTEPGTGSDAGSVTASIERLDQDVRITGNKLWVTFGQLAGLYLVIGQHEGHPTAVLVERSNPGLRVRPVSGQLGLRAAMLAEVEFDACTTPTSNLLGKPGFGFTHVASTALDHGRYSVAWGCVGIGSGCLEQSIRYASRREQFGSPISEHQLIRKMISDMHTDVKAARALCLSAGRLRDSRDPKALSETMIAKYFAARMLPRVTNDAVQIHGAVGIAGESVVERHFRDAKIMQIIEGTDQMLQLTIADFAMRESQE